MGAGHDHEISNDTTFEKETRMEKDRKLHLSHFIGEKNTVLTRTKDVTKLRGFWGNPDLDVSEHPLKEVG